MPFIIRWPATIPAGTIDSTSVISATDVYKSLCTFAGGQYPSRYTSDGVDVSKAWLGKPLARQRPLYWEYGRNEQSFKYPAGNGKSPSLAVRKGKWKLLMNKDGSHLELYDIESDTKETKNVASSNPRAVQELKELLMKWWNGLPTML